MSSSSVLAIYQISIQIILITKFALDSSEIELHGTKASLSADRYTGKIQLIRQNQEVETLHELPPAFEFGNRFEQYVFPALSPIIKGTRSSVPHPTLEDGWLAQRFTDAAYLSAKDGHWRPV